MRDRALPLLILVLLATPLADAAADDDLDFALKSAKPATRPASTLPATAASPLTAPAADPAKRKAVLTLSNGEKIRGRLSTTLDKPVRLWDDQKKEYRDVPFEFISAIRAKVVWERDEREWKFRESGSDLKEYSGRTYPARETQYTLTLTNGQSFTGGVVAPLYLDIPDQNPKTFVLHKRDKGEVGQTLKDLVYVTHVDFADQ